MDRIIIVAHGSLNTEVPSIERLKDLIAKKLNFKKENIKHAYLQNAIPSLQEAMRLCVEGGAKRIVVFPLFISSGRHVTHDIPAILESFNKKFGDCEIIYASPLGLHEKLVDIIVERIKDAINH